MVLGFIGTVIALNAWSAGTTAIPMGVLGDSGSQAYHDLAWFPLDKGERGGAFRSRTFQWTEVLARLRGNELDQGPWTHGVRPDAMAQGREWLGLTRVRAAVKHDFLYNQAISGATCNDLMRGQYQQAPRLVALMNQSPERWKRGVVVIRIGQNDWGALIDLQSRHPEAPELNKAIAYCKGEIVTAVALIHASHPLTRILIVGVVNEADDPSYMDKYQTALATYNLRTALGRFNGMLRNLASGDPKLAYFDDDAWFESQWGSRTPEGKWDFQDVTIGSTLRVTYTAGDDPRNALVNDHHGGLAWNALWAQSFVGRLNQAFGLTVKPISNGEVERFVAPLIAPESRSPN
jgi:hypothetical protein